MRAPFCDWAVAAQRRPCRPAVAIADRSRRRAAAEGAGSEGFLDEAEHIGRSAVRSAISPEDFAAALDAVPLPAPAGATAAWWRTMSGDKIRIAAQDGLPDAACFALMLQP